MQHNDRSHNTALKGNDRWLGQQMGNLDSADHQQGEEDEDGGGSSHNVGNDEPGFPV